MKPVLSFILLICSLTCACAEFGSSHQVKTSHHKSTTKDSTTPRTYKKAIDESEPVSKSSSPASPLIQSGIDEIKNENIEKAEWNFEQAINLDPDYGPAYYWLARVRYKLNQIDAAKQKLKKASALLQNSSA